MNNKEYDDRKNRLAFKELLRKYPGEAYKSMLFVDSSVKEKKKL